MSWTYQGNELRGPGGALQLHPDDGPLRDLLLLIAGETSGRALNEVLTEFGCSRSAYYEKLRRFHENGLKGLFHHPSGPHAPWRRTQEVIRRIVLARLRDPCRTAESIAQELARDSIRVSVRSVERTLSEFGLTHGPEGLT